MAGNKDLEGMMVSSEWKKKLTSDVTADAYNNDEKVSDLFDEIDELELELEDLDDESDEYDRLDVKIDKLKSKLLMAYKNYYTANKDKYEKKGKAKASAHIKTSAKARLEVAGPDESFPPIIEQTIQAINGIKSLHVLESGVENNNGTWYLPLVTDTAGVLHLYVLEQMIKALTPILKNMRGGRSLVTTRTGISLAVWVKGT